MIKSRAQIRTGKNVNIKCIYKQAFYVAHGNITGIQAAHQEKKSLKIGLFPNPEVVLGVPLLLTCFPHKSTLVLKTFCSRKPRLS